MLASIEVLTFRKGLLARLGHDLCLSAERFILELRAGDLHAEVWTGALHVQGAMQGAKVDRGALSASDRTDIERAVKQEVLHSDRHPKAILRARARVTDPSRFDLDGQLELHGHRETVRIGGALEGSVLRAELELHPSRFGIQPYRALGGALKLDDRVVIRARLPVPAELAQLDLTQLAGASARWTAGDAAGDAP